MTTLAIAIGAPKTGTSTVAAICNADPDSHFLYEVDFAEPAEHARNQDFVRFVSNSRHLFGAGHGARHPLSEILRMNATFRDRVPAVFGTKIPGLVPERIAQNQDVAIIYTARDIRTWLCKNRIFRQRLGQDQHVDVVPVAISYADMLLASFEHDRSLRLCMEEMLLDEGNRWPRQISDFLSIEAHRIENWWAKRDAIIGRTSYSNWAQFHDSSFIRPAFLDTRTSLTKHAFWDAFLPIFDKYFRSLSTRFSRAEIAADRRQLAAIAITLHMTLAEGFEDFQTFTAHGYVQKSDGKKLRTSGVMELKSHDRTRAAKSIIKSSQ